jgi:hypothetical protein
MRSAVRVIQQKSHEKRVVAPQAPEDSFSVACRISVVLTEMGFLLNLSNQLAFLAAALLAGLLVEGRALDVPGQPLLLACLLEALEELVETFVHPDFDANQIRTSKGLLDVGIIAKPFAAGQHLFGRSASRQGEKTATQILRPKRGIKLRRSFFAQLFSGADWTKGKS